MNEREEFANDLTDAGVDFLELATTIHDRGGAGDCWFGALGYLVIQLANIVAGRNEAIELTPAETKVAVRAYTNISRTFKILKSTKRGLLSKEDWASLTPFGEMMNKIWHLIPGQQKVRDELPGIVNPKHPAWRREKKNGTDT